MRTRSGTRIRTWRRLVAGVGTATALVLSAAGCSGDAADQEITDVDDTQAPVDPTVEPVE